MKFESKVNPVAGTVGGTLPKEGYLHDRFRRKNSL
jgi:hypothetical protein